MTGECPNSSPAADRHASIRGASGCLGRVGQRSDTRQGSAERILSLSLHVQFGRTCTGGSADVDRGDGACWPHRPSGRRCAPCSSCWSATSSRPSPPRRWRAPWATPRVPPACPPRAPRARTRRHTEALSCTRSSADLEKRCRADVCGRLLSDFQTGYAGSIPVARSTVCAGQRVSTPLQ